MSNVHDSVPVPRNNAPPDALRAALFAKIAAEPAPSRPKKQRRDRLFWAIGFAASIALFLAVGGVSLGNRPVGYVVAISLLWSALFLIFARLLVPPRGAALGPPRSALVGIAVGAPIALATLVALGRLIWPATAACDGPNNHDDRCFFYSCLFSAPVLFAFLLARSGTLMRDVALHGAAFGSVAGCFGALLITLRCVYAVVPHLLLGHIAPVTLLGVLVALVAKPLLQFRENR